MPARTQHLRRSHPGDGMLGGFSPRLLPGLVLWLRADMGITIGTGVSAWADQSGAGNHLTQATGAKQPTFVASGQNGRPCARFALASSQVLANASANLFGAGAYTFFGIWNDRTRPGSTSYFMNGSNVGSTGIQLGTNGGGTNRTVTHSGIIAHTDGAMSTNTTEIWCVRRVAASLPTLQVNGSDAALSAGSATLVDPGLSPLTLGAFGTTPILPTDLDAYEIFAFNRGLTDAERALATAYTRSRYAL